MAEPTGPRHERPRRARNRDHRPPEPKADRAARGQDTRLRRLRAALRAQQRRHDAEHGLFLAIGTEPPEAEPAEKPVEAPPSPPAAEDDLPEAIVYRDTGCHKWPACLTCPLPRCIFDRPAERAHEARRRRNRAIRTLYRRGWRTDRIARRFGISPAQARRIRGPRKRRDDGE